MSKLNVNEYYNEQMRQLIADSKYGDADEVILDIVTAYVDGNEGRLDDVGEYVLDLFNEYATRQIDKVIRAYPSVWRAFVDEESIEEYIETYGEEDAWDETLRQAWILEVVTSCVGMSRALLEPCVLWDLKKAGIEFIDSEKLDILDDWCDGINCKAFAESIVKEEK